jgi:hypothetical protein
VTASKTIGRIGAASAVVVLVVGINIFANIVPTDGMMNSSLSWYLIVAIIPAITADIILNNSAIKLKMGVKGSELLAGAIVGSTFYIFSYPMIAWVFAIPFDMQIANLQGIEAVSILTSNFLGTGTCYYSCTRRLNRYSGCPYFFKENSNSTTPRKWDTHHGDNRTRGVVRRT